VRIAIVNDLPVAREALRRVVQSVPGYQVAWQAADGAEAVARARQDRPDVILMDLIMPVMNGVEATRQVMQSSPSCAILVVTVSVKTNYNLVIEAINHGALDAVNTPVLTPDGKVREGEALLSRLARWDQARRVHAPAPLSCLATLPAHPGKPSLLALGASTGGPEAVARILEALPANFDAPVIVVQHMYAEFIPVMVGLLRSRCQLPVDIAQENQLPRRGAISVAATDDHLILKSSSRFGIVREPIDYPFRPSVNALFESLRAHWPGTGVAVLLTGLGNDGAQGMALLRQAGWLTLAQDQGTSVVYGMPKAAAETHAASRVLPLGQIPAAILTAFAASRPAG
jgi:two-component system response regulator WspF